MQEYGISKMSTFNIRNKNKKYFFKIKIYGKPIFRGVAKYLTPTEFNLHQKNKRKICNCNKAGIMVA